jgi:Lrp/AsnC family leucine-responsive transcriptional regulator
MEMEKKLGIDERDKVIIDCLASNPHMSQVEIGKKIKLSQPSTGARIQKLKEKGLISVISGINFRKVDLYLAKVEVAATDTQNVLESFDKCPSSSTVLSCQGYTISAYFLPRLQYRN